MSVSMRWSYEEACSGRTATRYWEMRNCNEVTSRLISGISFRIIRLYGHAATYADARHWPLIIACLITVIHHCPMSIVWYLSMSRRGVGQRRRALFSRWLLSLPMLNLALSRSSQGYTVKAIFGYFSRPKIEPQHPSIWNHVLFWTVEIASIQSSGWYYIYGRGGR